MTSCNIFGLVKSAEDIIPFLPVLVPQVRPHSDEFPVVNGY
jgi:hypothetical protein